MAKVKKDSISLYIHSGGYIVRPLKESQFEEGDRVKSYHFGGTPFHGVGKDESCGRGEYVERWVGCEMHYEDPPLEVQLKKYKFYLDVAEKEYEGSKDFSISTLKIKNAHSRKLNEEMKDPKKQEERRKRIRKRLKFLD